MYCFSVLITFQPVKKNRFIHYELITVIYLIGIDIKMLVAVIKNINNRKWVFFPGLTPREDMTEG